MDVTSSIRRPPPFFIGDDRALDFLNTVASPAGQPVEWLGNGADLLDWLEQAGAIDATVAARFRTEADAFRSLDAIAEEARALREWLRGFVRRHAGRPLSAKAIRELEPLNRLLARDDQYRQVEEVDVLGPRTLRWRAERRWTMPEQVLQPIAEAIGDLVCHADFRYVRECEGPSCTLLFYDRSKTHGRRWCSMAVCGNRAKAAAHRARQRAEKSRSRPVHRRDRT